MTTCVYVNVATANLYSRQGVEIYVNHVGLFVMQYQDGSFVMRSQPENNFVFGMDEYEFTEYIDYLGGD